MRQIFDTGDLVEITMLGSNFYKKKALVIEAVGYGLPRENGVAHVDEFSCRVWIVDPDEGMPAEAMIRAKWLKTISRIHKEEYEKNED